MISEREQFLSLLFNQPPLRGDAVICLAGEDGEERLNFSVALLKQGTAPFLIISGSVDSESQQSAKTLYPKALAHGIHHERVILEENSTNTREQAVECVAFAQSKEWRRILLVASHYHAPRAHLTFLKALQEVGQDESIQLVSIPADHVAWFQKPRGKDRTRLELLSGEMGKIALYSDHCASFDEGIKNLKYWEGK